MKRKQTRVTQELPAIYLASIMHTRFTSVSQFLCSATNNMCIVLWELRMFSLQLFALSNIVACVIKLKSIYYHRGFQDLTGYVLSAIYQAKSQHLLPLETCHKITAVVVGNIVINKRFCRGGLFHNSSLNRKTVYTILFTSFEIKQRLIGQTPHCMFISKQFSNKTHVQNL